MRVIAGSLKGRRLKSPGWEGLRPTSDKLRETLFNVLAARVSGARVLDGYAGTGAVGLEALSRGAAHVTFVERDRRAQALIAENLAGCGMTNGYVIIPASFARASKTLCQELPFDIAVFDPPYADAMDEVLLKAQDIVAAEGILVLEHARRRRVPERVGRLVRVREVMGGDSMLAFYGCQL